LASQGASQGQVVNERHATRRIRGAGVSQQAVDENSTRTRERRQNKQQDLQKQLQLNAFLSLGNGGNHQQTKQFIEEIRTSMRNHCRLFTVFLHDSCQLATRLFRSGRCSQIKIDCDEELIRNVFIRLDRDVGIRFTCWFLTLCTKSLFNIESVNPPMSPMSLFDAEYKTSISRNNSTASPAWPGICLSPVLCRWPADEISELVDRPLPELVLTLEQEQKADRKHGGIEIMLIPCATFLAFLDEFNDEQPDETVDFMTMMNRRIGDAIVEWAFSNISREIIRRDDLTPAELHKLRMRLALLAVLCYNFCDTENPTESADSGAYFRKLFELLNRICCPTEPLKVNLNSDIQRPRVLSWSVRANKRSAARSAARTSSGSYVWELILEGTENKILLQFPEDYIKKRVVIAIQYLAMCDCSGLFKKLADRWDYFEYPCIIEFMRLKKNVGEEVKPPTHF
uniref:BAF250_C domain-containing protein n=1 Tax=Macrostomum lignano TaxID=282301 RepID=A0A1I8J7D9_9PLAT